MSQDERIARADTLVADTVVATLARQIRDGDVIATGVASYLPILAIAAARRTHAPNLTYLACVGSLDPDVDRLAPSAESLDYLSGSRGAVTIPDLFDHALRGRVDVMFFGAAEIDAAGDTNLSAIGSLDAPTYKFPGVAGAATLRRAVKRPVLLITRQSRRNLVPRVRVASTRDRARATPLVTDLGVFAVGGPGARLVARHPWASTESIAKRTGFAFRTPDTLATTPLPEPALIEAIRAIDPGGLRQRLVA